ncbi:hypothetical protein AGMMS50212_17090 [Spirochaetia bacterium]|nr:hypothetical protein AGMMS50212_17090 [Spirochaetia bacterium]
MKKLQIAFFVLFTAALAGAEQNDNAIDVIVNNFGSRSYSAVKIPKTDLDKIVNTGYGKRAGGN